MLLKEQFEATIARIGIEDDTDYDLASIIWKRCEDAMLGKTSQEAALLSKATKLKRTGQVEQLTLQEVQFLNDLFAEMLSIGSENLEEIKAAVQKAWLNCNPDDEKTEPWFRILNELRNKQRKWKKAQKQLSEIQRKLKKSR